MSYDFSFTKKTISFLLGGSAFVGIMLFIAGLLVGANWWTEQTPLVAAAGPQPLAAAAALTSAPAPVPKEPVLKAEAESTQAAAAPDEVAARADAPAPVKQSHSSAPVESGRALVLAPLREAATDEVKIIERADTAADDSNEASPLAFSVQVGVFVDENAANQLVRQLQSKGYTPIILTAADDESRQWYAVRIGAFANRTEATQAAANISAQEKIRAIVRPLGSL